MTGVTLYVDGAAVASTAAEQDTYVAMEALGSLPTLSERGDSAAFLAGSVAGGPLGPFFTKKELTADEVSTLYGTGREALSPCVSPRLARRRLRLSC